MKTLFFTIFIAISITSGFSQTAKSFSLEIIRGKEFIQQRSMGIFSSEITPHIAVWLEDKSGNYLSTIFVSLKDGEQDFWVGNREHPLKAWKKARNNKSLTDAIASASPSPKTGAMTYKKSLPANITDFVVKAEINMAFDFNATYTEEKFNPWGQPALLYTIEFSNTSKGSFEISTPNAIINPNGLIVTSLYGIDRAKNLISKIILKLE